jgi:hypothetical protein
LEYNLDINYKYDSRLSVTKSGDNALYISYITITPKTASCSANPSIGDASLNGSISLNHLLRTYSLPEGYLKGTYPTPLIYTMYISRDFEILNCCQLSSIVDQISLFWIIFGHFGLTVSILCSFLIIDYFRNFLAFFEDLLILILQKSEDLVEFQVKFI